MTNVDLARDGWRKSSRSGAEGGTCVELAAGDRVVLVRDSKNPGGGVLAFGKGTWGLFTTDVRRGRYDRSRTEPAG